jgi:hypothetical protein
LRPGIFAIKGGVCYAMEVKDVKGKQNGNQRDFQEKFDAAVGVHIVARRLEDAQLIIEGRREAA